MNESVAVTKVAETQKDSSPTKSDNSGHRAQNEPEMQLGSLRGLINTIRHDGGTPSVDSIATQLSGMTSTGRASVLQALQQTHGNLYVQQVVLGVQAKLMVGQPNDRYEQEADRVADVVMRMSEPQVQRQLEVEEEKKEDEELVQTKTIANQNTPRIQRQVEEEEEEEEEEELIQPKPLAGQITTLVQRQPEGVVVQSKSEKSVTSSYPGRYVHRVAAWIQAKLKPGPPNDRYEQEADRVADAVLRTSEPQVQRQLEEEEEEEELIQPKPLAEQITPWVQRQPEGEVVQSKSEKSVSSSDSGRYVHRVAAWIQAKLKPGPPNDRYEQEADRVADTVMRMSEPQVQRQLEEEEELIQTKTIAEQNTPVVQRQVGALLQTKPRIQRQEGQEEALQTKQLAQRESEEKHEIVHSKGEPGQHATSSSLSRQLTDTQSGGAPLPETTRTYMETQFGLDFSQVRVHTDNSAIQMNQALNAQAFTRGSHIFFGSGRYNPNSSSGQRLLAHELTHVVQQGGSGRNSSPVTQPSAPVIQRSEDVSVVQQSPVLIQRLGIGDAFDYFAERANLIPGFRMFTIILGLNPINMSRVDRSAANILRAVIEFIPGGRLITLALDNYSIFDRVGDWVEQQIRTLGITGNAIRQALTDFLDSLSWTDIFDLSGVWRRARRIFTEPINRITSFARGLATGIIRFIKEAILRPLARLAEGTRGYDLLKAVLGQDPITGDPYPRTADTLIGGFMRLIGQEEVWNNIKRANAVDRAWAWFQGALSGLLAFVRQIPSRFMQALGELELADIVLLPRAFLRVGRVFAGFIGQFISWAGRQVMSLLQIIFEVVAPGVMPYIRRAAGAFRTIIRNPIGFVRNLVRAGIHGFQQFAGNFLTHLRASLIGWLTGTMSGANIYIPQAFNLREILKFVLSVLGITWQNIRRKLVRVIGERAVSALETGFELVRTLVTEGPAAAWQQILEGISNLREMVMEQIMNFVRDRVVQAAITRLVTSLNPAGAFIQAIIATYNTIMFFVERLRQIAQVAMAFIDSIAAIAGGNISAAANRVEQTMAGMLTLVISFLARIAGLGNVARAVTNIINRVRRPIDRALDRVVAWIVRQARRLGRFIAQAGVPQDPNERLRLAARAAITAARGLRGRVTSSLLAGALVAIRTRYGLESITPFERNGTWWVRAVINPTDETNTGIRSGEGGDDRDVDIARARTAFDTRLFSRRELQGELSVSASTAGRRITDWKSDGQLHQLASAPTDPLTLYSFDAAKAGQRETNPNNRAKYGYSNPSKTSSVGLQVLTIGLLRDRSPAPVLTNDAEYHRTKAWYRSVVTSTIFRFVRAILGHRPPGASGHWNHEGHTQPREDNMAWNRSLAAYHGPEEADESSATGGSSERYRVPSKEAGSHESWL